MLGTLITSITSFYFGSKASNDPALQQRPAAGPAPQVSGVTPPETKPGGDVNAHGLGLLTVDRVALRQGAREVSATNVRSSATDVAFTLPKTIGNGSWQVALKTQDGVEIMVPDSLIVG
jgi:hypothetical protein